jgi:hypothetical protein
VISGNWKVSDKLGNGTYAKKKIINRVYLCGERVKSKSYTK